VDVDGLVQPAPAPRFSRTPSNHPTRPRLAGEDTVDALVDWGISSEEVADLVRIGVLASSAEEVTA
jgi:alpha-methylacyl-CoA racemase